VSCASHCCGACVGLSQVTRETSKKFCPSCGNHSLMRVAMYVNMSGKVIRIQPALSALVRYARGVLRARCR
jgi:hypothetical protein